MIEFISSWFSNLDASVVDDIIFNLGALWVVLWYLPVICKNRNDKKSESDEAADNPLPMVDTKPSDGIKNSKQ